MNRSEPRIDVEATEEARVVLSIPQGNRARTLAPEHARDLAGILLEAAEAAEAHRAALGQLGPKRNRPNARPAYDGRVRLSLGNVYVDVDVAEALRHADKIVDTVEELEAGALATTASDGPVAAAFAQLAEVAP